LVRSFHFAASHLYLSCNIIVVTADRDNIKMGLKEVGWCGVDWILVAWGRDMRIAVVNVLMNLTVT
jgi:hypothetical protein